MSKTESVAIQMGRIMDQYSKEVKEVTDEAITQTANESRRKLRNTSPKKTGHYARGWSIKKVKGRNGFSEVTIHNKADYQLTHLLENGHVVRNQYGTWGRTSAEPHIAPAEQEAVADLVKKVEEDIEKI